MFSSLFDRDILDIADSIRRDVERSLHRRFDVWDLLESEPAFYDPRHTAYRMKMVVDDNGHVTTKTIRKDPGQPWETYVRHYDRGNAIEEEGNKPQAIGESNKGVQQQQQQSIEQGDKTQHPGHQLSNQPSANQQLSKEQSTGQQVSTTQPFDQELGTTNMFRLFDREIHDIADSIRRDVERSLSRTFDTWDLLESEPAFFDPRHSTYRMKMVVNDNGHVTVKTARKDPGQPWETYVKHYDKGSAIEGEGNKPEAIGEASKSGQQQQQQSQPLSTEKSNRDQFVGQQPTRTQPLGQQGNRNQPTFEEGHKGHPVS